MKHHKGVLSVMLVFMLLFGLVIGTNPYLFAAEQISINGFVWLDSDEDGMQDNNENGIANINVKLYSFNDANEMYLVDETSTNANGEYEFLGTFYGKYRLEFDDWQLKYIPTILDAGDDSLDSDGIIKDFIIDEYEYEYDYTHDVGFLNKEKRLHSVGGLVWYDSNRDGIQGELEPGIPNIKVRLYGLEGEEKVFIWETYTRVNGSYEIIDLANGRYQLEFDEWQLKYKPTIQDAGNNDYLDSDGAIQTFFLEDDNDYSHDFGLVDEEETNYKIGDYVWYDINKNGIQDDGAVGIGNVKVKLFGYDDNYRYKIDETLTSTDGFYQFEVYYLNERYELEFSEWPVGYVPTLSNQGSDDVRDSDGAMQSFLLNDAIDLTHDLGLVTTQAAISYQVGDYVWLDNNSNGIQDASENGVANVDVKLYRAATTSAAAVLLDTTTTDSSGHYQFSGLSNGDYQLEFSNWPANYSLTNTDVGSDDAKDSDGVNPSFSIINADNMTLDLGLVKPKAATNEEDETTTEEETTTTTETTTVVQPVVPIMSTSTAFTSSTEQTVEIEETTVPLGSLSIVKTGNNFPETILILIAIMSLIGVYIVKRVSKNTSL